MSGPSLLDRVLGPSRLVRALALVLAFLLLALAAGSVLGLAAKRGGERGVSWQRERSGRIDGLSDFEGIGNLRLKCAGPEPALLSVSVVLSLPSGDRPFREELIAKVPRLKETCLRFFGSLTAQELSPAFEGGVKARLRDLLNAQLSLGKIEALYFPIYQLIP